MNKTKIIYKTVAILIILVVFAWFWQLDNQISIGILKKEISVNFGLYSGIIFCIGFFTSAVASLGTIKSNDLKTKEYEKKLSTTSVDSSKDKSKIEALERKIATLEKALESKLDK